MYARMVKALDRVVLRAAARGLERENAGCELPVSSPAIAHPEYFADIDLSGIRMELDRQTFFRFRSPVKSPSAKNNVVHGRFFKEKGGHRTRSGKAPLVILLHGWNGEKGYEYLFPPLARRLAGMGVATMMMELPYHGLRKPGGRGPRNFLSGDLNHMMGSTRQAIADIRALVHLARDEGYESVGLWGVSLGAWLGGLAACVEPNLHGLVLMSPVPQIDLAIEQLPFCRHIRKSMEGQTVDAGRLNLVTHRPKLPPERILIIESRHDLFAPAHTVEDLWRAWGEPEIWRVNHGHISVLVSIRINDRAARWVKNCLERSL